MIIWIFSTIIGAGVLLMAFVWTRLDQQDPPQLIPAPIPVRDPR
jgi:hypothetical protein